MSRFRLNAEVVKREPALAMSADNGMLPRYDQAPRLPKATGILTLRFTPAVEGRSRGGVVRRLVLRGLQAESHITE